MKRSRSGSHDRRNKSNVERLPKYIAGCGYCSRRRAEMLIEKGLVKVNGEVIDQQGWKIVPGRDEVTIHGETLVPPDHVSIVLNKPAGYITSTHDTHERLTVMDLLPKKLVDAGVLPAGRLDLDTEGLLVLTNDGDLQHRITHPRYECEKEYKVLLSRPPSSREQERLERGIYIDELGKKTSDARIGRVRKRKTGHATLHITICEGMKRQVRRMFQSLGIQVLHLDRLSIAGVGLDDLARGEWRELTIGDVARLRGGKSTRKTTRKATRRTTRKRTTRKKTTRKASRKRVTRKTSSRARR